MSASTARSETTGCHRAVLNSTPAADKAAPPADSGTGPTNLQLLLVAMGLLAYGLGSHWLMVHAGHQPWAVAALFGPLLLGLTLGGWQRRHLPTLAFCALVLCALVVVTWRGGVDSMNGLYVLQHAGIHLALAWTFGMTLRPGSTALITAMAQRLHGHITPAMRHYTHELTRWWVLYFLGMTGLSFVVYLAAPWSWWSFFCNLLTPAAALAFFMGEYLLRYRLHPEFERMSWRRAAGAYRAQARPPEG
jgi:uncharacterized membrane protein